MRRDGTSIELPLNCSSNVIRRSDRVKWRVLLVEESMKMCTAAVALEVQFRCARLPRLAASSLQGHKLAGARSVFQAKGFRTVPCTSLTMDAVGA